MNCLSVFDHFAGLALNGLSLMSTWDHLKKFLPSPRVLFETVQKLNLSFAELKWAVVTIITIPRRNHVIQ